MFRRAWIVFFFVAASALGSSNDTAWRADVEYLAGELPARHKNAFFHTSRAAFEQATDDLIAAIPSLADHEVVVRMMQLVASIGDGHTTLSGYAFSRFPVRVYWFTDGLYVTRATAENSDLLGSRLVSVDGHAIEEVTSAIASIIPHENDPWLLVMTPSYLVDSEVLQALGIAADPRLASFVFEAAGGTKITRTLVALDAAAAPVWSELPDPANTPVPMYRRNPELNYWYEYLPQQRAIYFKYNRCREIPDRPMETIGQEIGALMQTEDVDKLVLDMRDNGGGDSGVLQPVIASIPSVPSLNRPDHLFVIVGRATFSSAMLNAAQLDAQTNATLVGEPTGGKPNSYGEVKTFPLPNSGLTVGYSTKYFQLVPGDPPSVMPAVTVRTASGDYFAARDPVLETILRVPPRRRSVAH